MVSMSRLIAATLATLLVASLAPAADWPTVHHDVARSAYVPDSPAPPFTAGPKYKWVATFSLENIDSWAEAIVWQDKVFVGTYAGNLYGLDRATGQVKWKYDAGGMIIGSPAVYEGTVYVGSIGGDIHALDPSSGKPRWTFHAKYGFWTSPCVHKGLVMMGGRDGILYALDAGTGQVNWKYQTPRPILTTAAATDDFVLFASEEGRGYCLNISDGSLKWKTVTMYAATMRGYYPVIWGDAVAFFTLPTANDNKELREDGYTMLGKVIGGQATGSLAGKWPKPISGYPTAEEIEKERQVILDYFQKNPRYQSLWAFRLADGKQKFIVPRLYSAGNEGVDNPGAVDPDGWLYTTYGSWYGNWCGQQHRYPYCLARINYTDGRVELLNWAKSHPTSPHRWDMTYEWDEGYNFTVGGRRVYSAHQDLLWGLELDGLIAFHIAGMRDRYGGIYGFVSGRPFPIDVAGRKVNVAPNEWHGSGRGAVSICGKELFWCIGGMVICMEGQ